MRTTVVEVDPRACHQVLDRAGDEDLAGAGKGSHPCPDVHRNSANLVVHELDLASVQAGAHLKAERSDGGADGYRASDRPCRAIERGEKAIASRVDLAAPEAVELGPDDLAVGLQQVTPAGIAELGRATGSSR